MFLFKVLSFFTLASAVLCAPQSAAQYPAGVNPALCPGFPICDNARLHDPNANALPIHDNPLWNAHAVAPQPAAAPQPQWNSAPQPQWNAAPQPQWNAAPQVQQYNQWQAQPQQAQWNHAPAHIQQQFSQWNQPAHQPAPQAYTPVASNRIDETGGDKYPAGVSPQSCPNYPYCDSSALHSSAPVVQPLPGFTERLYPAGVNPQQCPNFPICS